MWDPELRLLRPYIKGCSVPHTTLLTAAALLSARLDHHCLAYHSLLKAIPQTYKSTQTRISLHITL